jgi:hypothetical protein
MPSNDEVMNYLKIYFDEIHPYVPVVHRAQLYYQWQHDRKSISPLLLEALFACAGRLSDDPAQGAQWLALATSETYQTILHLRHLLTTHFFTSFQDMSLALWTFRA